MPNIVAALKEEISRLARKEIRNETSALKKASSQYRRDIAKLKRQISSLQSKVTRLEKQTPQIASTSIATAETERVRFTAKGLVSQRKRLGLSAADYGKLVGVTGQTIYSWENELSRPRQQQVQALASVRTIGKKEARARLKQLTGKDKK
ncbi:MAG: helix-turn-helix domain-containing protein [Sedimentisphaerales bacterium]|jgi:DNA-binding transcriptional regulator YiaG